MANQCNDKHKYKKGKINKIFLEEKQPLKCCCTSCLLNPSHNKKTDDVMLWRHTVTSWYHTMTSHYIIMSRHRPAFCMLALKPENHRHHVFWPGELDLWPWPSNSSEILSRSIRVSNFVIVWQSVQLWECSQTDTHTETDRLHFHNLDRWCGR